MVGRVEPKWRKQLNDSQIEVLKLLYRFRFGTADMIAKSQGREDGSKEYARLRILLEQDYIGRKYEPEYRLQGRPASYFLRSKGVRVLGAIPGGDFSETVLKSVEKDKKATDQFIAQNLAVYEAYNVLKSQYGQGLTFFTKSDQTRLYGLPEPFPDAYVQIKSDSGEMRHYFLDIHQETRPFYASTRRIKQYVDYVGSSAWTLDPVSQPTMLAVCDTPNLKKRLHARINKEVKGEANFLLTTIEALKSVIDDGRIWEHTNDATQLLDLS